MLPRRARLTGRVAGIEACEIIFDQASITVGSSVNCDLCVADPLVPRRAFTVRRLGARNERPEHCAPAWVVETVSGSRVYVNDTLTQRDRIAFGDTISTGCHRFVFGSAPAESRNFKSNTRLTDVCARLMAAREMPAGFARGTPGWQGRRRLKTGMLGALSMAAALAALLWLIPRAIVFEQVQPPLEVVMVSDRTLVPELSKVRSMQDTERRTAPAPADELPAVQIADKTIAPTASDTAPAAQPLPEMTTPEKPAVSPAAVVNSAGNLAPVRMERSSENKLAVPRPVQRMAANAPMRRLSMAEATDPQFVKELGSHQIRFNPEKAAAVNAVKITAQVTDKIARPVMPDRAGGDPAQVAALMQYQPSPVTFEKVSGARVPIARLPGKLAELEVKGAQDSIVLDGTVSEAEIAMCWKSGQFRADAPGNPPPFGTPPTYCYVGKADLDGNPCLYVSFVCIDPAVEQVVDTYDGVWRATPTIPDDDSIEIYLDINFDRLDYHQLIVNTSGKYWGQYCKSYHEDGAGRPWDPRPRIKTTISKDTGRWMCEVMIPFDQLGGVPAQGSRWSVNFYRNYRGQRRPDHALQNWFLVYEAGSDYYHNPARFGIFQW